MPKGKIEWSFNSWIKEHQLVCRNGPVELYSGYLIFLAGLLAIPQLLLSDKLGRKAGNRIMIVLCIFEILALYFASTFEQKMIILGAAHSEVEFVLCFYGIILDETERKSKNIFRI